jgi:hypothetical protein
MAKSVQQSSQSDTSNNLATLGPDDPPPDTVIQFYDDSSDEDDTNDALSSTMIDKVHSSTEKLNNDLVSDSKKLEMMVSFINYSAGLGLYNAEKVKNIYHMWKKEHLGECVVPDKEVVTSVLKKVIDEAIRERTQIKRHSKASKKLTKKCSEHLSADSLQDDLLMHLNKNLKMIMRRVTTGLKFPKKISDHVEKVDKAIREYLKDANCSTIIKLEDFDLPLKVTACNLYMQMTKYLRDHYSSELREKDDIRKHLNMWELITPARQHISTSQKSKTNAEKLSKLTEFTAYQKEYFLDICNLTNHISLQEFNDTFDANFLKRRMQKLIDLEEKRGESSIIQNKTIKDNADFTTSQFHEYEKYMDAFKPCTAEIFRKLMDEVILPEARSLEQNLKTQLGKKIQEDFEQHVWRSSLPTMHLHKIGSVVDYIASLRLTRRSLYRTFRNQSLGKSVLGKSKEEHHDIGWQFQNIGRSYVAIERTRITAKACSSLVQIETGANSYQQLGNRIQDFLKSHPIYSDGNIVIWIRQTLTGGKVLEFDDSVLPKAHHDLTLFLVQLAHLFVGTESIRYPAALVQSQMIMDLIEAEHLKWSEAFIESEDHIYYPMILEKATNICRTLDTKFHKYSDYSHKYPGEPLDIDDEKISRYISAELKLTTAWLKIQPLKDNLDPETYMRIAFSTVFEAISRWYPSVHQ